MSDPPGVVGYVTVLAGGLVVSVVPDSSWVASLLMVSALRADVSGRMLGLAVVVAGLGSLRPRGCGF